MKQTLKFVLFVLIVTALFALTASATTSPPSVNSTLSTTLTGTGENPWETESGTYTTWNSYQYGMLAIVVIDQYGNVLPADQFTVNVYNIADYSNLIPRYGFDALHLYLTPDDEYFFNDFLTVDITVPDNCQFSIMLYNDTDDNDTASVLGRLLDHVYHLSGQIDGFSFGYGVGTADGYENGYYDGYNVGLTAYDNVPEAVFSIVSAPFEAITNFLNFEILGINLKAIIAFLVMAIIVTFVIKKVKD